MPSKSTTPTGRGGTSRRGTTSPPPETGSSFRSGWDDVENYTSKGGGFNSDIPRSLLVREGETATIQFLSDSPLVFDGHTVRFSSGRGSDYYKTVPCSLSSGKRQCTLCNDGGNPTFRAAWFVIDFRGTWVKDDDDFDYVPVIKIWDVTQKVALQLREFSKQQRRTLDKMVINVTVTGKKTSKAYNFSRAVDDAGDFEVPYGEDDIDFPEITLEECYAYMTEDELHDAGYKPWEADERPKRGGFGGRERTRGSYHDHAGDDDTPAPRRGAPGGRTTSPPAGRLGGGTSRRPTRR